MGTVVFFILKIKVIAWKHELEKEPGSIIAPAESNGATESLESAEKESMTPEVLLVVIVVEWFFVHFDWPS